MSDPVIVISYDEDFPALPIGALAAGLTDLLQRAVDLPQPCHVGICDCQKFELQFYGQGSSSDVELWAYRFGGELTTEPADIDGITHQRTALEFSFYGVAVKLYTYEPVASATA